MANVNANINVNFQTQQAVAQLRQLTAEINRFNKQTFAANSAAAQQQRALNQALVDGVRTSGQFRTSIVPITSAVDKFSDSIERNKLTLGQYTRYAGSQIPGLRRIFTREFDMINRVAEERVKRLSTQFVALGESANGMRTALAMTPNSLDQFAAKSAIALQRQQIFNRLLRDGSTQLLNWGKNTQWAGRQLMVGFTIPLGLLGAQAAKVFRELEAEAVNFKKVYGDMFTTDVEVEKNLAAIKELSVEMTKYGQTAQQTMQLANTAAQAGARGAELMAATTQATRLAILGQMEQNQAIETTISLQTAFSMSNERLAESINFLNSVENQTILSLQDVSEAIPRVASVIKGFGGDVEDLAVLLVAMKEGGVSAAEGANALKNSMARVISPTKNALEVSSKYGIALQDIVTRNEGKVVPLFQELARALEAVGGQERQEILSAIFGKFQYARIGTLLSNIAKDGSQAATAIELTGVAARDLAATAERELGAVEDAVGTKFTAALEKAKIALAPVGEEFLKALTPVLDVVGKILSKFDELPSGLKTAMVAATAIIGGIAPIVLMVTGLVANAIANIAKFILFLRKQTGILRGNGEQFKFYTMAELDAAAAAASLDGKTSSLTKTMLLQKPAIESLITLYGRLAASARAAAAAMPATMGVGRLPGLPRGGMPTLPQARNSGGPIFMSNGKEVPGSGNTDKVPAMLTPGEYVVNKEATQSNRGLLEAINSGEIIARNKGGIIPGVQYLYGGGAAQVVKNLNTLFARFRPSERAATQTETRYALARQGEEWKRQANLRSYDNPDFVFTAGNFETGMKPGILKTAANVRNWFGPGIYTTRNEERAASYLGAGMRGLPEEALSSSQATKRIVYKIPLDESTLKSKFLNIDEIYDIQNNAQLAKVHENFAKNMKERFKIDINPQVKKLLSSRGRTEDDGLVNDRSIAVIRGTLLEDIERKMVSKRLVKKAEKEIEKFDKEFTKKHYTQDGDFIDTPQAQKDLVILKNLEEKLASIGLNERYLLEMAWVDAVTEAGFKGLTHMGGLRVGRGEIKHRVAIWYENPVAIAYANKGGMIPGTAMGDNILTPKGLTLASPEIMKAWAKNKSRKMQASQSKIFMANNGNIVPGTGNTDTIPAMLTPGEFVVNKQATQQNLPLIQAINDGKPVSYLNKGTQSRSKKYSTSDKNIREQTKAFRRAGIFSPEVTMLQRMFSGRLDPKQLAALTQYDASHMTKAATDAAGKKIFNPFQLRPELAAMNNYYPRMESSLKNMLDTSMKTEKSFKLFGKETTLSAKIAEKTGLTQKQVYKELTKLRDGVTPATDNARNVARRFAQIDAITTRAALQAQQASGRRSGPTTALGLPSTSRKDGVYRPQAYRSEAFLATQRSLTNRGFFASPQNVTYAQAMGMQPLPKAAPAMVARTPLTYTQANSTQAAARRIMREAPGTNARQALQIARLQQMAGPGGGGGGRTPTFLGMPDMPERPRQSMLSRINSGIGRVGMGAGMALSMASMLPMMKQDEQGKFMGMDAGTAMMGMMGGGMLLSIAPMLGSAAAPILGVAAIIGAVGITAKVLNDRMRESAEAAAEFGANVGGTANALNTMSTLFGEQTPAQRQTQMQLKFSEQEQEESFGKFQNYLGSEFGQKFLKDFENLTSADRFKKLSDYVRGAIASGLLNEQDAVLFAKTVGSALDDAILGSAVIAELKRNVVQRGPQGLLDIAERRRTAVSLRSTSDPREMIGSSIQIVQDYANALALANEEFINGTLSYEEFAAISEKAMSAQKEYSKSLSDSLINVVQTYEKVDGELRTVAEIDSNNLAAFNKEMSKILSKEQLDAMKKATETGMLYSLGLGQGIGPSIGGYQSSQFEAVMKGQIGAAIAAGIDPDMVISAAQTIRTDTESEIAKSYDKLLREGSDNALFLAMFEETSTVMAETLGLTGDLTEKFNELGRSIIDAGGNFGEFQTFLANLPQSMTESMLNSLTNMTEQGRKTTIASGTRLMSLFGEQSSRIINSRVISSAMQALETPEYTTRQVRSGGTTFRRGGQTTPTIVRTERVESEREAQELRDAENIIADMKESFGDEVTFRLVLAADAMQNGESIDVSQWNNDAQELAFAVQNIQNNVPAEIYSQLNIDFSSSEDILEWSRASDVFARSWSTINQLDPNINKSAIFKFLTLGADGKELTPEQVGNNVAQINKAMKDLGSENKDIRTSAIITISTSMLFGQEGADGIELTEDSAKVVAQENLKQLESMVDEMGGNIYKADPNIVIEQLQVMFDADQMRDQGEKMQKEAEKMSQAGLGAAAIKMAEQGTALISAANVMEEEAAVAVKTSSGSGATPPGDGGGGGQQSPVQGFVEGILNQFKMWVDASAKMADLNNAKTKFVDMVLKGDSIFNKLSSVKGISASRLQEILGMGPEGAQEFLDKYVRGNKLTKAGKNILDAAALAGINQTIGTNILSARQMGQQTSAANFLSRRGEGSQVIQSIAGDPQKAAQLVRLRKEYNQAVKSGNEKEIEKANKVLNRYINSEKELVKIGKEREEATKSVFQKQIDANNKIIEANNEEMEKGDDYFEKEERRIIRNYRDRIKAAEDQIDAINDQIDAVDKLIEEQEKLNRADQNRIRDLERQKEMLNRQLEELDRANELDERRIETLQRDDELRSRVADALERELELMSREEDKIRAAYDKRIEALDEVARINDYIIDQQRQQVDLSRAISEGDIYAATQAAQSMRASSGQFATEQVRSGLQQGMENQIAGLRTSQGLTRGEAEQQIQGIQDQSYQTSLLIRDIEDAIYNRNLQMIPIKDQIRNYDMQIRDIQDQIYDRETTILGIQTTRLEPLQTALSGQQDILETLNDQVDAEIDAITYNGMNALQWADNKELIMDQNKSLDKTNRILEEEDNRLASVSKKWRRIIKQIDEANRLARDRMAKAEDIEAATVANIPRTDLTDDQINAELKKASQARIDRAREIEAERQQTIGSLMDSATTPGIAAFAGGLMKYAMGGMITNPTKFTSNEAPPIQKRASGGMVFGSGARDSIAAMLTPGEFVIRKAMVDKYGIPLMEALNQGSFAMPRYDTGEFSGEVAVVNNNMTSNINAPVYNTYDMKFSINGTNQSADEIANKVMFKMKQIQNQGIRGNRGY